MGKAAFWRSYVTRPALFTATIEIFYLSLINLNIICKIKTIFQRKITLVNVCHLTYLINTKKI